MGKLCFKEINLTSVWDTLEGRGVMRSRPTVKLIFLQGSENFHCDNCGNREWSYSETVKGKSDKTWLCENSALPKTE